MIAQEQAIEDQYKALLESQKNRLLQKKMQDTQEVQNQQGQLNNQYQELYNNLDKKKVDTQNQYKTMYTGLDTQAQQGQQKFYGDRNQTAVNNAAKVQQIRDYMARNNLLQSGESVDAQLRNNTDFSNSLGQIATNEAGFMQDIGDKRNQYQMQEQSAYNDIGNQYSSAQREQAQKALDLTNKIKLINDNALSEEQAMTNDVEYRKLNDLNALRERLRQEEVQRQAAARAASSSAKASSSKVNISNQPYENSVQKDIYETLYSNNKISSSAKLDTLDKVINNKAYDQEDRDYADRMRQALLSQSRYDAAYANYRGGY